MEDDDIQIVVGGLNKLICDFEKIPFPKNVKEIFGKAGVARPQPIYWNQ